MCASIDGRSCMRYCLIRTRCNCALYFRSLFLVSLMLLLYSIEWNHNAFPSTLFFIIGWRLSCRYYYTILLLLLNLFSHWFLFLWINYSSKKKKKKKEMRSNSSMYCTLYTYNTVVLTKWLFEIVEIASDRNRDTDLKLIYSIYFTIVTSELPSKLPKKHFQGDLYVGECAMCICLNFGVWFTLAKTIPKHFRGQLFLLFIYFYHRLCYMKWKFIL